MQGERRTYPRQQVDMKLFLLFPNREVPSSHNFLSPGGRMKNIVSILLVACMVMAGAVCSHAGTGPEEAKAMVKKAIAAYKANGKEKTFAQINDPNGIFKKGDIYVFVYDLNGVAVARPVTKALIGKNLLDLRDPDGRLYVMERIQLVKAKGNGWQAYKFVNPETNKYEDKIAYVEGYDGYVFGCGSYRH